MFATQFVRLCAIAALGLVLTHSAAADPLRATPADAIVVGSGAGLWIASEVAKPEIAPAFCRLCEASVNGIDRETRRALVLDNTHAMSLASNLGGYLVLPLSAGLLTLGSAQMGTTMLLVAQSAVLTADVNQAVKFAVGRTRPYARFGHDVGVGAAGGDDHLSFFSGHTAVSFSLATASYAWMREEKPAVAPLAGGLLFAGAGFVGYSRIAADRHYLSDVLVGAAVGSVLGWLTMESHRSSSASVRLDPSRAAVSFRYEL